MCLCGLGKRCSTRLARKGALTAHVRLSGQQAQMSCWDEHPRLQLSDLSENIQVFVQGSVCLSASPSCLWNEQTKNLMHKSGGLGEHGGWRSAVLSPRADFWWRSCLTPVQTAQGESLSSQQRSFAGKAAAAEILGCRTGVCALEFLWLNSGKKSRHCN